MMQVLQVPKGRRERWDVEGAFLGGGLGVCRMLFTVDACCLVMLAMPPRHTPDAFLCI